MGNGVVMTMIPVLDVLFRKSTLCRFLMPNNCRIKFVQPTVESVCLPKRTLSSPIAFAFHKERADVWSIPFVIRIRACQRL